MIQTMGVCANGWGVAFTCHGDGEVADLRVRRLADLSRFGDADLGHALDADSGAWPGLFSFSLAFSVFRVGW